MGGLIFYIVSFLIAIFFFNVYLKTKKKKKIISKIFLMISAIIPIFISGCRYNVGTDYEAYAIRFIEIGVAPWKRIISAIEIGDFILCKISYIFSGNIQFTFLTYSILTVYFGYKSIIEREENNTISLVMFLFIYFPMSFNVIRQACAMVILLYAYKYLHQKQLTKYIVYCGLAMSFHTSAIIMIILGITWQFINEKNKSFYTILVYVGIAMSIVFIPSIVNIIEPLKKYESYFSQINVGNFGIGAILNKIPILMAIILYGKTLIHRNKENRLYVVLFIISIAISQLGYMNVFFSRLTMYFEIINIFLLPNFISIAKRKEDKAIIKIIIYLYAIIYNFINKYYIMGAMDIFPYMYRLPF